MASRAFKERVLFDTGSRHLYAMKWTDFEAAEPLCRKQNPQQVEGISYGCYAIGLHGTEPFGRVAFLALDRLSFGGFGFCHVHALTTQGGAHVGAQLLRHGAVVLNPGRKRIVFQPYSSTDHCVVGNEQLKKAIINEKGKPVVGLLWERSDAYKAGLRQGDVRGRRGRDQGHACRPKGLRARGQRRRDREAAGWFHQAIGEMKVLHSEYGSFGFDIPVVSLDLQDGVA